MSWRSKNVPRCTRSSKLGPTTSTGSSRITVVGTTLGQPCNTARGMTQHAHAPASGTIDTAAQRHRRRVLWSLRAPVVMRPHSGQQTWWRCRASVSAGTPSMPYQHFGQRGLPRARSRNSAMPSPPRPSKARRAATIHQIQSVPGGIHQSVPGVAAEDAVKMWWTGRGCSADHRPRPRGDGEVVVGQRAEADPADRAVERGHVARG